MLLRLAALCTVAVSSAWPGSLPERVTGMLEYVSPTAMVLRVDDKREIQMRVPQNMPGVASGRELGDWVEVRVDGSAATFDKGLSMMLHAQLAEMSFLRKPTPAELESAQASPVRRFSGNLLAGSSPHTLAKPAPSGVAGAETPLGAVLRQVGAYLPLIPRFIADEETTRFTRNDDSSDWTPLDTIETEFRYDRGHETRTHIFRNGEPWGGLYSALPGMRWRAAYVARLRSIFLNPAKFPFTEEPPEMLKGYEVAVCSFHVPADGISRWYEGPQSFWPAVDGKAWISREDGRVLQMELSSGEFPDNFPLLSVNEHIEFDYVAVGSHREALPVASQVTWVQRESNKQLLNKNIYTNYRPVEAAPQLVN